MGWFEKLNGAGVPALLEMEPIWPFQPGVTYSQVDLDGRDAVEGVAHYFKETGRRVGGFALMAAEQIEEANGGVDSPDKPYAVYVGTDKYDCLIAYVYARDDYSPEGLKFAEAL